MVLLSALDGANLAAARAEKHFRVMRQSMLALAETAAQLDSA